MADLIIPVASLIESGSGSEMVDIQFSALDLQFMNRSFWQDGLLQNITDNGKVTPLTGLQVNVAAVAALIDGTVCKRPEATTLTVAQGGAQKRYDLVIIKRNLATRSFSIELKQGVEGGTKPTLAYTVGGLCEFELATIEVSAGALAISSGDITNTTVIIDPRPNLDERFDAKMNADFSNTTMVRWPVEVSSKSSMPNWYVVYNDGWCEQGGYLSSNESSITFTKAYKDTSYFIKGFRNSGSRRGGESYGFDTKTSTGISNLKYAFGNDGQNPYWLAGTGWEAKGYIN